MFDPVTLTASVLAILAIAIGGYSIYLHHKGVPKDQLATQLQLKMGGDADAIRDHVSTFVREFLEQHQPKLLDGYFDVDDFQQDIGRLPVTFVQMVSLTDKDGQSKIVKAGAMPALEYRVDPGTGNVLKKTT